MELTTSALYNLAAQQAVFGAKADPLDRICAFIYPFLPREKGKIVSPKTISNILLENYGLAADEGLASVVLGRLARNNHIEQEIENSQVIFQTLGTTTELPQGMGGNSPPDLIDEVIHSVRTFVESRPIIPQISDDEILELLRSYLFDLDMIALGNNRKERPDWKYALISDFVISSSSESGQLPTLLSRLSELNLIRHALSQLTRSKKTKIKKDAIIIIDSPIALQFIGASGGLQKQNMESIAASCREIGVRMAVLQDTIEEMQRVLTAVLAEDHLNRRGPTASALRKGEISETIVNDMARNPSKYLKNRNVGILPYRIGSHPDLASFFPEKLFKEFCGFATRWASRPEAQDHDAIALALTMRLRKGASFHSLLEANYTFVTSNWVFKTEAERFCLENFLINPNSPPPIVHLSDFSSSVWLAAGLGDGVRMPEKSLLAACEKVLSSGLRPVGRIKEAFESLTKIAPDDLALLVQDSDSIGYISSQISYDPSLVTESNAIDLIRRAKARIAAEQTADKDRQLAEQRERFENERAEILEQARKLSADLERATYDARDNVELLTRKYQNELRLAMEQKESEISALRRAEQERLNLDQTELRERIDDFDQKFSQRRSTFSVFWWLVVPGLFGLGAAIPPLAGVSYFANALIVLLGVPAMFGRGPIIAVSKRFYHFRASREFRLEFSGAEIHRWGLILTDDNRVEIQKAIWKDSSQDH